MPNFCPHNVWELSEEACSALRSMQRRRTIITACWKQVLYSNSVNVFYELQ